MIAQCLKEEIETFSKHLVQTSDLFDKARRGALTPQQIGLFLVSLRYAFRRTDVDTRLASERAERDGNTRLARHFVTKGREERGHDQWADNDIQAIRTQFNVEINAEPAAALVAMLEHVRNSIRVAPELYLAYGLFAEYITVLLGDLWVQTLEKQCQIPASAMTAISYHVELDQHHVEEGLQEINALVDSTALKPMREMLHTSMKYFEQFCDEVSCAQ